MTGNEHADRRASVQNSKRDRRIAIAAIVVGVVVAVAMAANVVVILTRDAPASSDDLDRFVACIQNVVFANPETVAQVREDTIGAPRPAAGNFCDKLALEVRHDADRSTSTTGTTLPP